MKKEEETAAPHASMHASPEPQPVHNQLGEEINKEKEDTEASISPTELQLLDEAGAEKDDDMEQQKALLDNTDDDGEALNEQSGESGNDLDVPGSELDDADEALGEEDEENNSYSLDKQHDD